MPTDDLRNTTYCAKIEVPALQIAIFLHVRIENGQKKTRPLAGFLFGFTLIYFFAPSKTRSLTLISVMYRVSPLFVS